MATATTARRIAEHWRAAGLDPDFAVYLEAIPSAADRIAQLRQEVEAETVRRRTDLLDRIASGKITAKALLDGMPGEPAPVLALIDEANNQAIDTNLWKALAERGVFARDLAPADEAIVARAQEFGRVVGDARTGDQALSLGGEAASAWSELLGLKARRDALVKVGRLISGGFTRAKLEVSQWRAGSDTASLPRRPESDVDGLLLEVGARIGEEVAA